MKIEFKEVDTEKGITRVTTADERWYFKNNDPANPVASVTWIAGKYPKGRAYYKWLADKGWDEAEAIKMAAANKGSKVHQAVEYLLLGNEIEAGTMFKNTESEQLEELTVQEWLAIMSFIEWFEETKPEVLATEQTVWNEEYGYAGTLDLKCRINGEVWIVDLKTSADIWPEHELQVSAYKHTPEGEADRLAILQIGYKRNKTKKWKFTEIADRFDLFLAARLIWQNELGPGDAPKQYELPITLKLSRNENETVLP